MNNNIIFNNFYDNQNEENKQTLNAVLNYIKNNKTYNGMKLRTTNYRIDKLIHYINDLDGTLMIDLLYTDIQKIF